MSTRVEDRKESREGLKAALSRQPVVAAVDLGASKVTCFIMKAEGVRRGDRTLTAAGVGYVQSRGVRGGAIINLDEASDAIAQAVERAENVAGVQVQGVTVATAGGQLTMDNDPAVIERLWNPFVAAWYEEGKTDPKLRLLRYEPDVAEIWLNENSLLAGVKTLLGIDPKKSYQDDVAKVKLGR